MTTADDHALAARVAGCAGDLLMALRESQDTRDAQVLRAEGDRRSNELIIAILRDARPHDAVLSEESVDDGARLTSSRVWIVDPLDGTREFGELDRTDWAVHVALWEEGELVAGAVALPALKRVWGTGPAVPVDAPRARPEPPLIAVSRSRPPAFVTDLCAALDADPIPMGSAGAKAMAVVTGRVDAYVHAGGQYEWDSAAPVAVARAAGLYASRVDGSPLRYNRPQPYLPDLVICRPDLAETIVAKVSVLLRE